MPLEPVEKAAIGLRLAAALYLEPLCSPGLCDAGRTMLRATASRLHAKATEAPINVRDHDSLVEYLKEAATDIDLYLSKSNAPALAQTALERTASALRNMSVSVGRDDAGDGSAVLSSETGVPSPCPCGFLALAASVERHVAQAYAEAGIAVTKAAAPITYATFVTPDIPDELSPFKIGGETDTSGHSPVVRLLVLKDAELAGRDLWQLAYTLHHELVCHGYQGICAGLAPRENAPPECHWSEGWMDTVAFALAEQWATIPDKYSSALTYGGSEAVDAMREMHAVRFSKPKKLKDPDLLWLRKHARQALNALVVAFSEICDVDEARRMAWHFSLLANGNAAASPDILGRISVLLQSSLLNPSRPWLARSAVQACLGFMDDRELNKLEDRLRVVVR